MVIVGVLVSFLLNFIVQIDNPNHNRFYDVLVSIFITILIWEGNLRIDHWMNRTYPWISRTVTRILVHLPVSIVYSALSIFVSMFLYDKYVCAVPSANQQALMGSSIVIGVLVSIVLLSVEISSQFFSQWKASIVEVEKHKKETTIAQLESLKAQVNPHFLFNNLSVLSSLVYKDQDKAVEFINQLSKVYRYLLDNKERELVDLNTELTFVKSYCFLLNIRFGDNVKFEIDIPESYFSSLIPPMALQILIENTFKHNEVSMEQPLHVSIKIEGDWIVVSNPLQPKKNLEESSKSGLKNILSRYKHYTSKGIRISDANGIFEVRLPLLNEL
jgi:two-component system LytT family sensor kinase